MQICFPCVFYMQLIHFHHTSADTHTAPGWVSTRLIKANKKRTFALVTNQPTNKPFNCALETTALRLFFLTGWDDRISSKQRKPTRMRYRFSFTRIS